MYRKQIINVYLNLNFFTFHHKEAAANEAANTSLCSFVPFSFQNLPFHWKSIGKPLSTSIASLIAFSAEDSGKKV